MVLQGQVVMASLDPDPSYPYYPVQNAPGALNAPVVLPAMAFLRVKLADSGHIVPLTIPLTDMGLYTLGTNVTVTIAPAV